MTKGTTGMGVAHLSFTPASVSNTLPDGSSQVEAPEGEWQGARWKLSWRFSQAGPVMR